MTEPARPRSGDADLPSDQAPPRATLTEDLMLLLFQPASGTIAGETTLFWVLGGAVLADLSRGGHLEVSSDGRGTRLRVVANKPPTDELLLPAWESVRDRPGDVRTVLPAVGPTLREPTLQRLIARDDVRERTKKTLGLFTTTALTEGGSGRRAGLVADVRAVLVDGATPDPDTAALVALLSASDNLHQLHREIPWTSAVIARAEELERGSWGASAAADAVTVAMLAIITNTAIATATAVRS